MPAPADGAEMDASNIKDEDIFEREDTDIAPCNTPVHADAVPTNGESPLEQGQGEHHVGVTPARSEGCKRHTLVPGSEGFIMGYATLPGSPAYHDTVNGSLYIQELCTQLTEFSHTYLLDCILDKVTDKVKETVKVMASQEQKINPNYRLKKSQIPFKLITTSSRLVLNP